MIGIVNWPIFTTITYIT